jgi:hypothetical protein
MALRMSELPETVELRSIPETGPSPVERAFRMAQHRAA